MSYENYDPCFPDQPVVDLYLKIWAQLPSFKFKPAFMWVEDGDRNSTLTYEQLNKSAQCIASNLLVPLNRGDTVVVLCDPGLQLVEFVFGCQRAGLIAVPIVPPTFDNPNFHHLIRVISQTKPKAAIANQSYIKCMERYISDSNSNNKNHQQSQWLKKLKWIASEDVLVHRSGLNPEPPSSSSSSAYNGCKPEDVYLIQYTSGATGIPKPVIVTAAAAAHNVRVARKAYDLHPNSVIVSWLPQYHDCGLMFLLLTVVSGATCVLTSPSLFVQRPRIWLELITSFGATCTPVPSFALPLVLKRGGIADGGATPMINLASLKNLIIINEPIYKALIDEFVKAFRPYGLNPSAVAPSYGLAENCTFVSTAWRTEHQNEELPCYQKLLPSARLDSSSDEEEEIEILVVDEETRDPVEDGIEGEIWISSPSNASGYLGHPSLTREVFNGMLNKRVRSYPFVRTGDRGLVIGKEKFLFVTGRISDTIKVPGSNSSRELHPHYIETIAYGSNPKNLRGGCLAAFLCSGKVVIVAEMQHREGEDIDFRRICEGIRKSVMEEECMEVGVVVLVKSGSVPKTTSGKVRRWLAKDNFVRGKMSVVLKMNFFEDNRYYDLATRNVIEQENEKEEVSSDMGSHSFPNSNLHLTSSL
ncbi:OLC1v1005224C1 [Oldenlandia corymbosa var. corymbosa]|uniref:OLC1v1005224C1 n=1 Tax=Oldenlandia corymbosa var. corymbosa TaxID=529605 RepID=A0AAV1DGJ6_OLDCO|nr:OLC1v1005224C1 [Oldenlandia corymbosa var. corymbosa]